MRARSFGPWHLISGALVIGVALHAPRAVAVAQRTGDFELEIDAPRRLEPSG